MVRCNGILQSDNLERLTFFFSDKFSKTFRSNLYPGSELTLMGCSLFSFESYQYKGEFLEMHTCTPEEEELQRLYMDAFTDAIEKIGFSKENFYEAYFYQPSYGLTMTVRDVFEQTPRKGTGNAVISEGDRL